MLPNEKKKTQKENILTAFLFEVSLQKYFQVKYSCYHCADIFQTRNLKLII